MSTNFLPVRARIDAVTPLAPGHRLFALEPETAIDLHPGQFIELSLPGLGAFPVSGCDLVRDGLIRTCVRAAGRVTEALFRLAPGAEVGVRGPFGNGFPLAAFAGSDALLVAGGLGMAPLRALLHALLADAQRSGRIVLLYGAREPDLLLFREELLGLAASGAITLKLSVDVAEDFPCRELGAVCEVGLVGDLLDDVALDPARTTAAVCGPPVLYGCLLGELEGLGVPAGRIFATLERRMRCGVGECCHCVAGGVFLCQEGPVFSLDRLRQIEGAI